MREIKFRAWSEDWSKYSKPFTLKCDVLNFTNANGLGFIKSLGNEIVEQFTGLRDKKRTDEFPEGQPIFEGDLVKYSYKSEYRNYSFVGVVEYDTCNPCFVIVDPDNNNMIEYDWIMCGHATLEVVGNIHENKELLK